MNSGVEVRIQSGDVTALVAPEYADAFNSGWFNPEFWQDKATPVSVGGRGSAWFVEHGQNAWVLRHYRRGGLVARIVSSNYLYFGASRSRPFREFRVLSKLSSSGFPVPKPIGAIVNRAGLSYTGAIIIERFINARPLGDCLDSLDSQVWREIGRSVRSFHDAGVYHADLNCFNVLLRGSEVFLIDFDKARIFSGARNSSAAKWKIRNLERLKRSIYKVSVSDTNLNVEHGWAALLDAYNLF